MKLKVKSLGLDLLDYDACSTLWVRSWDDYVEFVRSEEYRVLAADTKHFMDVEGGGIKVMAG